MSQISNMTLANGEDTPVTKTFEVGNAQMGTTSPATWYEKTGGTFSSFKKITSLVRRSGSNRSTKVTVRVTLPATTADGVAYNCLATVDFTLPDDCTEADRKDLLAFSKNLLGDATLESAVHDMSPAF